MQLLLRITPRSIKKQATFYSDVFIRLKKMHKDNWLKMQISNFYVDIFVRLEKMHKVSWVDVNK